MSCPSLLFIVAMNILFYGCAHSSKQQLPLNHPANPEAEEAVYVAPDNIFRENFIPQLSPSEQNLSGRPHQHDVRKKSDNDDEKQNQQHFHKKNKDENP